MKMMSAVINSLKMAATSSFSPTSDYFLILCSRCSCREKKKNTVHQKRIGNGDGWEKKQRFCYQIDHYKLYLTCSVAGKTNSAASHRTSPITPCPFRSINSCSTRTDLGERDK